MTESTGPLHGGRRSSQPPRPSLEGSGQRDSLEGRASLQILLGITHTAHAGSWPAASWLCATSWNALLMQLVVFDTAGTNSLKQSARWWASGRRRGQGCREAQSASGGSSHPAWPPAHEGLENAVDGVLVGLRTVLLRSHHGGRVFMDDGIAHMD